MSCNLKRPNSGLIERSEYDKKMLENYMYHAAPWPMNNTNFDKNMKQTWCPTCPPPLQNNYGTRRIVKEGFNADSFIEANIFPRTVFDKNLQHTWCPKCQKPIQ